MLFEEIPEDFKEQVKEYLQSLLSKNKIIDDKYLELNEIKCPKNIKTQHHKFEIGSMKYINNMIELYYLLHLFHEFSIKNNILYSITAGNLLGYCRDGHQLLWDDDIDLLLNHNNSIKIIKELWDNSGEEYNIWDKNWSFKNIIMNNKNIILLKLKSNTRQLFKIKLNKNVEKNGDQIDIGGLDIDIIISNRAVTNEIKNTVFNQSDENEEKYPIITYGTVQTRILKRDLSIQLLDCLYGKNWVKKIHPSLFKDFP